MTVSILVLAGFVTGFDTKYVSLKIFRNTVLLCLQYRQRAIQRETRTGACFVSLNQVVVLLSVSDLEMSDICCECFSVVLVIVTNLANSWIYLPLHLHVFSAKNLLKKPYNFFTCYCRRGCYLTCLFEPCEVVAVVRSRRVTSS